MKPKIKIVLALVIGLAVSQLVGHTVFLADSPIIRRNLGQYVATSLVAMIPKFDFNSLNTNHINPLNPLNSSTQNNLANQNVTGGTNPQPIPNALMQTVSKGVYAAEDKTNNTANVQFNMNEIPFVQKNVALSNGQQVTVNLPADMKPLTQDEVNKIFYGK